MILIASILEKKVIGYRFYGIVIFNLINEFFIKKNSIFTSDEEQILPTILFYIIITTGDNCTYLAIVPSFSHARSSNSYIYIYIYILVTVPSKQLSEKAGETRVEDVILVEGGENCKGGN